MRGLRTLTFAIFLAVCSTIGGAFADYVYTDANGLHTVFSFICQSTKLCTGFVLMDSTGTEKATPGNPVSVLVQTPVPPVTLSSLYPSGATPITASAIGTTGATVATLPAAPGLTNYLCGFSIRANASSAATGNAIVSGTISGTLNFTQWTAPLATGLGVLEPPINNCIPASNINTAIVVTSAAPGSGGTVSVSAWGYTK